ncbi:MAG TPA: hypothetical protein VF420_07090 [Casimicrobiaceae bacterium]
MPMRIALVFVVSLLLVPLRAAATDYTDIWYLPAESGWGVNLIQNQNVIFATFFVYGASNQPTWFVAILYEDNNGNFSGNLYTTVGPYYGGPWNASVYMPTLAGTASFAPTSPYAGSLTYTLVNGPSVAKSIQRQTLTTIVLGGNYVGGQSGAYSSCNNSNNNRPYTDQYNLALTQANGVATFVFTYQSGATCTMAGNLTQVGQLYQISPMSYSCTGAMTFNVNGTMDELRATAQGIEGTFSAKDLGCVENAQFSAVLY